MKRLWHWAMRGNTAGVLFILLVVSVVAWAATTRMPGDLVVTGDITAGDDAVVTDDITIGDDATIAGDAIVTGEVSGATGDFTTVEADTLQLLPWDNSSGLPDTTALDAGTLVWTEGGTLFCLVHAAKTWTQIAP